MLEWNNILICNINTDQLSCITKTYCSLFWSMLEIRVFPLTCYHIVSSTTGPTGAVRVVDGDEGGDGVWFDKSFFELPVTSASVFINNYTFSPSPLSPPYPLLVWMKHQSHVIKLLQMKALNDRLSRQQCRMLPLGLVEKCFSAASQLLDMFTRALERACFRTGYSHRGHFPVLY